MVDNFACMHATFLLCLFQRKPRKRITKWRFLKKYTVTDDTIIEPPVLKKYSSRIVVLDLSMTESFHELTGKQKQESGNYLLLKVTLIRGVQ